MSILSGGDELPLGRRLSIVSEIARDLSRHTDPQAMLVSYADRLHQILPFDRTVAISRRGLQEPSYRITRSDFWASDINPWTDGDQLPVFDRGLLGDLLYAGQTVLQNDFYPNPADPAFAHLDGMRSLVAIPHFDEGEAINMVIHLCRKPRALDPEALPDFVLLSSLFGRATKAVAVSHELLKTEARLRIQNETLQQFSDTILAQAMELKGHAERLDARVRERTGELREAHLETVFMLAAACEAKDADTGAHVRRIQQLSQRVAEAMALPDAENIGYAAILHDVGKMHVPDEILRKPGPLTEAERTTMEMHAVAGERILGDSDYFRLARAIARHHHENVDGSGYPDGLRHDQIPLAARIVRVVDFYDAVTNARVYKPAWTHEQAVERLQRDAGVMFDREVVRAFLS